MCSQNRHWLPGPRVTVSVQEIAFTEGTAGMGSVSDWRLWGGFRTDGFQIVPTKSRQAALEQLLALDTVVA